MHVMTIERQHEAHTCPSHSVMLRSGSSLLVPCTDDRRKRASGWTRPGCDLLSPNPFSRLQHPAVISWACPCIHYLLAGQANTRQTASFAVIFMQQVSFAPCSKTQLLDAPEVCADGRAADNSCCQGCAAATHELAAGGDAEQSRVLVLEGFQPCHGLLLQSQAPYCLCAAIVCVIHETAM